MSQPTADQLARIESLGLNCEVGNVLRRFGNEVPSLFRWTWAPPRAVLALLQADFAGLFTPENMIPGPQDEILDRRYDIWFHTNLKTGDPDGGTNPRFFEPDAAKRERVLRAEKSIVDALVARFRARMRMPHTLFILTRHAREPDAPAQEIAAAIAAQAGGAQFALLEVYDGADAAVNGTVEHIDGNLYRGRIERFAPYEAADDIDMASWTRLLSAALDMTAPQAGWPARDTGRSANAVA